MHYRNYRICKRAKKGRKFANPFYVDPETTGVKCVEPNEVFEILGLYSEIFGNEAEVLLLDEIQNLRDWNSLVKSLLNRRFRGFLPLWKWLLVI